MLKFFVMLCTNMYISILTYELEVMLAISNGHEL